MENIVARLRSIFFFFVPSHLHWCFSSSSSSCSFFSSSVSNVFLLLRLLRVWVHTARISYANKCASVVLRRKDDEDDDEGQRWSGFRTRNCYMMVNFTVGGENDCTRWIEREKEKRITVDPLRVNTPLGERKQNSLSRWVNMVAKN